MLEKRKYHRLGKRQLAVLFDMFESGLTQDQAIEKNGVSRWRFNQWLAKPAFKSRIESRFEQLMMQARIRIARSMPDAAEQLSYLVSSNKPEISRKAALDVIELRKLDAHQEDMLQKQDPGIKQLIRSLTASYFKPQVAEPLKPKSLRKKNLKPFPPAGEPPVSLPDDTIRERSETIGA